MLVPKGGRLYAIPPQAKSHTFAGLGNSVATGLDGSPFSLEGLFWSEPLTRQVRSKELGILQSNISMVIFSFDNGHLNGSIGENEAWIGRALGDNSGR